MIILLYTVEKTGGVWGWNIRMYLLFSYVRFIQQKMFSLFNKSHKTKPCDLQTHWFATFLSEQRKVQWYGTVMNINQQFSWEKRILFVTVFCCWLFVTGWCAKTVAFWKWEHGITPWSITHLHQYYNKTARTRLEEVSNSEKYTTPLKIIIITYPLCTLQNQGVI